MGSGHDAHYVSAYCVSAVTGKLALCTSGFGVPEQVNVQIASGDTVVIGWVTFEHTAPTAPPVVLLVESEVEGVMGLPHGGVEVKGVTHKHIPCSVGAACVGDGWNSKTGSTDHPFSRPPYYMHYVRLAGLKPRAKVGYMVKSGSTGAVWSQKFTFRAPYSSAAGGPTRIALYGDMGVYSFNNMQNLFEETVVNQTADLILHAGDHCYNEGDDDERRADAYMQAFEKTLANSMWMPTVGNHEFYGGTNLTRFLDQNWQKWGPIPGGQGGGPWGHHPAAAMTPPQGRGGLHGATSASSALGALISAQNHHGPALHAKVPSRTSRWFSVDFGLTHLVALSLNGYNGVDQCHGYASCAECNQAQLRWLEQDLAAVNRSATPWVIVFSHFPLYLYAVPLGSDEPPNPAGTSEYAREPFWIAERCEYEGHRRNCSAQLEHDAAAAAAAAAAVASARSSRSHHSVDAGNYTCVDGMDQPHAYNLPGFAPYRHSNLTSAAQCEALCTANQACVSFVVADCTAGSHWHAQCGAPGTGGAHPCDVPRGELQCFLKGNAITSTPSKCRRICTKRGGGPTPKRPPNPCPNGGCNVNANADLEPLLYRLRNVMAAIRTWVD
eukprot:COSAG01_NODE_4819_length_4719_cov_3.955628_1_plen_609_part_00